MAERFRVSGNDVLITEHRLTSKAIARVVGQLNGFLLGFKRLDYHDRSKYLVGIYLGSDIRIQKNSGFDKTTMASFAATTDQDLNPILLCAVEEANDSVKLGFVGEWTPRKVLSRAGSAMVWVNWTLRASMNFDAIPRCTSILDPATQAWPLLSRNP